MYGDVAAKLMAGEWESPLAKQLAQVPRRDLTQYLNPKNASDAALLDSYYPGANAPIKMRVPLNVVPRIFKSGSILNQHQTGTTRMGEEFYDPEERAAIEDKLFGSYANIAQRPKYGYLGSNEDPGLANYGGVVLKFNPAIRKRTTWTPGDSFNGDSVPSAYGSYNRNFISQGIDEGSLEAQIHGPLTVDDLAGMYSSSIPNDRSFDPVRSLIDKYLSGNSLYKGPIKTPTTAYSVASPEGWLGPRDYAYGGLI